MSDCAPVFAWALVALAILGPAAAVVGFAVSGYIEDRRDAREAERRRRESSLFGWPSDRFPHGPIS